MRLTRFAGAGGFRFLVFVTALDSSLLFLGELWDLRSDMLVEEVNELLLLHDSRGCFDVVLDEDIANLIHLDLPWIKVRMKVVRFFWRSHSVLCEGFSLD